MWNYWKKLRGLIMKNEAFEKYWKETYPNYDVKNPENVFRKVCAEYDFNAGRASIDTGKIADNACECVCVDSVNCDVGDKNKCVQRLLFIAAIKKEMGK